MSRLRHSLNDASVRASALLASWSGIPDLLPEKDMIALIKSVTRKTNRGQDDGNNDDGHAGGAGGVARARTKASGTAPAASNPGTQTTADTSVLGAGGKKQRTAPTAGPSRTKSAPALSRSSSTTSLKSEARGKKEKRVLLAKSGGRKQKNTERHPRGSDKKAATDGDDEPDVMVISSDSE